MATPPPITLVGRIERITYYNRENHFTIARLRSNESQRSITIKGTMPDPRIGESIEVRGQWETHARYGQQLRFDAFSGLLPATLDGIRSYLQSGFIRGVGPRRIERIINRFKAETLTVIEAAPQRLTEVAGIGPTIARRIADAWRSHHAARQLVRFLEQNGLDSTYAPRLLREYGNRVIDILCNDPYRVAEEIPRIGFLIADAVVRHADTAVDEMGRAQACLRHLMEQILDQGHAYIDQDQLLDHCRRTFEIDSETGLAALGRLVRADELAVDPPGPAGHSPLVFPRWLHQAEWAIARRVEAMQSVPPAEAPPNRGSVGQLQLPHPPVTLSEQQEQILWRVLGGKVSVITGGPGTGKTTLIRSITAIMQKWGRRVVLAAPTGRAARRLSEVSGRPAATLHKVLGYNLAEDRFERNEDDPLAADGVIVDEASMVDTLLMAHLIRAVPVSASLILVGDVFQLPSVGPGDVLANLIRSQAVPTCELTEIFRQAEQSAIVMNAHRVRNGQLPVMAPGGEPDGLSEFCFIQQSDPQQVVETVVRLCRQEIPRRFGLDPIRDIQVLAPMHRGPAGTLDLNRALQGALNVNSAPMVAMGSRFKVGDKVMHLRNNYRKEVFNGDIGILEDIDLEKERVTVDYDARRVSYDFVELEELTLAYAISVHKSQGSEYPAVVIPLLVQHYSMLQRNLLYTALTRAKQVVVLVGSDKALNVALRNTRPRQRRSMLARRLNPKLPLDPAGIDG